MRIAAAVLAVVAAIGCSRFVVTEIGAIQRNSEAYQDRTVTIRGTVTAALVLPLIEYALYEVEDRTGRIWVQSKAGAPAQGATVTVTGTVRPKLEVDGRNFAVVIVETRRVVQR